MTTLKKRHKWLTLQRKHRFISAAEDVILNNHVMSQLCKHKHTSIPGTELKAQAICFQKSMTICCNSKKQKGHKQNTARNMQNFAKSLLPSALENMTEHNKCCVILFSKGCARFVNPRISSNYVLKFISFWARIWKHYIFSWRKYSSSY